MSAALPSGNRACVIVPVYRTDLSPSEQASLHRCLSILGKHPVILAAPDTLDLTALLARHPGLDSEAFPASYFTSVKAYNRLMLADEFYARFATYEYMLIHQLDAFVFSDQLSSWCDRGYDYVGAPWIPHDRVPGRLQLFRSAMRRRYFRLTNRQYRRGQGDHHAQQHYSAGNGGFSLRRIAALRAVLRRLPERAEPYRQGTRTPWAEDLFSSIEANRYRELIRIPGFREALEFSWETHPEVAARCCSVALPFGCHGWDKLHRAQWRPVFASLGLAIDELCGPANAP